MAARRRRVRAVGSRLTLAPAPRPRRRARGLVGNRRAQVAERALRLRPRVLRASGCASSRDGRPRRATSCTTPARIATSSTGTRSSRAARAAFRSTRPFARSDARASPSSSRAVAGTRGTPPRSSRSYPGAEVLNEVVLNQVLFRFDTDERTQEALHAVQAERRGVAQRHHLGRSARDPRLGVELADVGRRHGASRRGVPRSRRRRPRSSRKRAAAKVRRGRSSRRAGRRGSSATAVPSAAPGARRAPLPTCRPHDALFVPATTWIVLAGRFPFTAADDRELVEERARREPVPALVDADERTVGPVEVGARRSGCDARARRSGRRGDDRRARRSRPGGQEELVTPRGAARRPGRRRSRSPRGRARRRCGGGRAPSCRRCAPREAPIGWPSATAPPFTLPLLGSAPSIFIELTTTDENASFSSTRSTSSIDLPAFASAMSPAFAGVRARNAKSSATYPCETIVASTSRPRLRANSSLVTITQPAPSLTPGAFPAVVVPFRVEHRLERGQPLERGVAPRPSRRPRSSSTGTISSAKRPASCAAIARSCERSAHASWSSREIPSSRETNDACSTMCWLSKVEVSPSKTMRSISSPLPSL